MGFTDSMYALGAAVIPIALILMVLGVILNKLRRFFAAVAAIFYAGIILLEWYLRSGSSSRFSFNYPRGEDQRLWTDVVATAALTCAVGAVLTIQGLNLQAFQQYLYGSTQLSKFFVIGFCVLTGLIYLIIKKTEPDDTHPLKKLHRLPLPGLFDSLFKVPE